MSLNYYRNISLLYIYSILIKRVTMPIITLYFLLNNLSFTKIGILAAAGSITTVAMEIHGGIYADIHGKKSSLILGSLLSLIGTFLFFIGNSFWYFLAGSILYGASMAFISGTREALLWDTLTQLKRTDEFKKFSGRQVLYSHLVNALVLVGVPVLYKYNAKLPFLFGVLFFLASLIVALFFAEAPLTKKSKGFISYNLKLIDSIKEIYHNRKAFYVLLLSVFTAVFVFMPTGYIQPLLKISGLDVIYFGIIYMFMRIIMGIGAEITHRLEKLYEDKVLMAFGISSILLSLVGFWKGYGFLIIIAVLLNKFAEGFNRIFLLDKINKSIKSENRTTILSISSFLTEIFNGLLALLFGYLADLFSVQEMFMYAILIFILVGITVLIFRRW